VRRRLPGVGVCQGEKELAKIGLTSSHLRPQVQSDVEVSGIGR